MLSSKCSPERTSGVRGIGSAPVPWAKAGHARNCAAAAAPPIAIVFTNRRRLDPRTQIPVSPFCRPIFLPRACSHVDIPPHVTHITRGVVLRKGIPFCFEWTYRARSNLLGDCKFAELVQGHGKNLVESLGLRGRLELAKGRGHANGRNVFLAGSQSVTPHRIA
jgi:hypothetical protein